MYNVLHGGNHSAIPVIEFGIVVVGESSSFSLANMRIKVNVDKFYNPKVSTTHHFFRIWTLIYQ